ncbi:MAG: kelch repeat-containing protein [Bacteroidota bacterium]
MKLTRILLFWLWPLLLCLDVDGQPTNTWLQLNDFAGQGRTNAFSFVINDKAYIGSGRNSSGQAMNDFWEYNPMTDTWTQKQNASGIGRWAAVGFAIGSKGYMGTGFVGQSGSASTVNDFYEYDPSLNLWRIRQNVGLTGRAYAVGFSTVGKGFIVSGFQFGTTYSDNTLWEYDPVTDIWVQRPSLPGGQRESAGTFTISGTPYVFGGYKYVDILTTYFYRDVYAYNPKAKTWAVKALFPSEISYVWTNKGFSAGGLGYSLSVNNSGTPYLLEYNPGTNAWQMKTPPPATSAGSAPFSLSSSVAYYLTGSSNSKSVHKYLPEALKVTGPQIVCASNSTFSLNYLAPGASVTWTKSPNVTYVSGQSTKNFTVSANSSGPGWVRADVSFVSGVTYYQRADFRTGSYNSSDYPIIGPSSTCSNQFVYYTAPVLTGATNYNWSWPSSWTYSSGQGTNQLALIAGSESGAVTLRVDNICGSAGSPSTFFTQVYFCGYSIQVFPNPSDAIIEIQFLDFEGNKLSTFGKLEEVEIEVTDKSMQKLMSCRLGIDNMTIPVSSFPEGQYYLKVRHGKEIYTQQIVIKR